MYLRPEQEQVMFFYFSVICLDRQVMMLLRFASFFKLFCINSLLSQFRVLQRDLGQAGPCVQIRLD